MFGLLFIIVTAATTLALRQEITLKGGRGSTWVKPETTVLEAVGRDGGSYDVNFTAVPDGATVTLALRDIDSLTDNVALECELLSEPGLIALYEERGYRNTFVPGKQFTDRGTSLSLTVLQRGAQPFITWCTRMSRTFWVCVCLSRGHTAAA